MCGGGLVAINAQPVNGDSYPEPRARGLVEREFNLSYMEQMPEWNELVSGKWWDIRGQKTEGRGQKRDGQLSVEEGIAQTLGIYLGDMLTYDVAGSRLSPRGSQLRPGQGGAMRGWFF